ncbi:hypothetical protein [Kaarinaea lacus]
MSKQHKIDSPDRRSGIERRAYTVDIGFPFVDTHGHLVIDERRKRSDRRDAYSEFHEDRISIEKLSEQTA